MYCQKIRVLQKKYFTLSAGTQCHVLKNRFTGFILAPIKLTFPETDWVGVQQGQSQFLRKLYLFSHS